MIYYLTKKRKLHKWHYFRGGGRGKLQSLEREHRPLAVDCRKLGTRTKRAIVQPHTKERFAKIKKNAIFFDFAFLKARQVFAPFAPQEL